MSLKKKTFLSISPPPLISFSPSLLLPLFLFFRSQLSHSFFFLFRIFPDQNASSIVVVPINLGQCLCRTNVFFPKHTSYVHCLFWIISPMWGTCPSFVSKVYTHTHTYNTRVLFPYDSSKNYMPTCMICCIKYYIHNIYCKRKENKRV